MVSLLKPPFNADDDAHSYRNARTTSTQYDHLLATYAQEIIEQSMILDEETADQIELLVDENPEFAARLDFFMDSIATDGLEAWRTPKLVTPAYADALTAAVDSDDVEIEPPQPVYVRSISKIFYNYGS